MSQRNKTPPLVEPLLGNKVQTLNGVLFWDSVECKYVRLPEQGQEPPPIKAGKHNLKDYPAEAISLLPEGLSFQELDTALRDSDIFQRLSEQFFLNWTKLYQNLDPKFKDRFLNLLDPQAEKFIAGIAVAYRLGVEAGKRSRG